jgi:integrase
MVKKLRAEIVLGGDPQAKIKEKRNELTYGEFMEDYYFPYITPLRRNARKYRELYDNKIAPVFSNTKVSAITKRSVQAFHSGLCEQEYSNAYCNRHLLLIKSSINVGINVMEVIDIKNPAVGIPLMEAAVKDRHLSQEELFRLMPILNSAEGRLLVPARIIRFLLATGLRLGTATPSRFRRKLIANRQGRRPTPLGLTASRGGAIFLYFFLLVETPSFPIADTETRCLGFRDRHTAAAQI